MGGYKITDSLNADLQTFKAYYTSYINKVIGEEAFRAHRVRFGILEQRERNVHMCVLRLTGGIVSPAQLKRIAELAAIHADASLHITMRGGLQLHDVMLGDLVDLMEAFHLAGVTGRGAGGNGVRNINVDALSGVAEDEIFDVTPHAIAFSEKIFDQKDSYNIPRKFKISFSASEADRGETIFADVGFMAATREGKRGFKTLVGGGMGGNSKIARLFADFIPETEPFLYAQAIKEVFNLRGNRQDKYRARLRFLIDDMGYDNFRAEVSRAIEKLRAAGSYEIAPETLPEPPSLAGEPPCRAPSGEEAIYIKRYARPQRQKGYFYAKIPLFCGDIKSKEAIALAEALEKIAAGREVMRLGMRQNIILRNLRLSEILDLYPVIKEAALLADRPAAIGDVVVCTGVPTCQLGLTNSRGAIHAIGKALLKSRIDLETLQGININLSGCSNACGRHLSADLGFYAKLSRKGEMEYPAYVIVAGAKFGKDPAFAREIAEVSAYALPEFCVELLAHWKDSKEKFANFTEWVDNGGERFIAELAAKHSFVPDFYDDKNPYFDYGAKELFSLKDRREGEEL
ncbi:MAG: nitrite/sulfite reductase [Helicobacteraceae bacterium]|jgi:sulfite reductase (ferredoxin)|nr:nitrite/sulfite reductase [Helicobacteraceae bacterium]